MLGIVRLKPYWFSAAGILLGSAALFRLLAYLVHGASFAMHFILVELVSAALYLMVAFLLHRQAALKHKT